MRDQHGEVLISKIPMGMWFGVGLLGKWGKCSDEFTYGCNFSSLEQKENAGINRMNSVIQNFSDNFETKNNRVMSILLK